MPSLPLKYGCSLHKNILTEIELPNIIKACFQYTLESLVINVVLSYLSTNLTKLNIGQELPVSLEENLSSRTLDQIVSSLTKYILM